MSWIWILLNSMNLIIINIICHRNVNREKCIYVYIIIIFVYVERFHAYHILYAHIKSRQISIFKQRWVVIVFQAIWKETQYSVAHKFWNTNEKLFYDTYVYMILLMIYIWRLFAAIIKLWFPKKFYNVSPLDRLWHY